jgi:hypothetical protein
LRDIFSGLRLDYDSDVLTGCLSFKRKRRRENPPQKYCNNIKKNAGICNENFRKNIEISNYQKEKIYFKTDVLMEEVEIAAVKDYTYS